MKNSFFILFAALIITSKIEAQTVTLKKPLLMVNHNKQAKITDTGSFNKTSSIFIKIMVDSLKNQMIALKTSLKEDTSEINATIGPFEDLMKQEIFKTGVLETYIDDFQKDKIVNFIIENQGDKRGRLYYNYVDKMVYNAYNSEKIEDYFESEKIISLKEYRTEKKLIKGHNCFKVIYTYREKEDGKEFQMPEMMIDRELWVTEEIVAPFHPIVRSLKILLKYYPLEIIEKISKVDGFETKYTVEHISFK